MKYIPGEKNIGEAGKKARSLVSITGFASFLVFAGFLNGFSTIHGILLSFLMLYTGFYGFFQAEEGFCGTYAALGRYKSGEGLVKVDNSEKRSLDISKSFEQNLNSFMMALAFMIFSLSLYSY
ncbi:MAG: hypothetical protein ABEJ93_03435 [Candidatus Nanohalobium sp.]